MEIFLALIIFGQIPITYADTTWTMYGGTLENTHFQKMIGAMETAPDVKWSYVAGNDVESYGAAVADVDGDGAMEVVIGSLDNKIYCLNGVTGGVEWSYATAGDVYSAATIADVDGDGAMEIVIASCVDKSIYCLNGVTGLVEWKYTTVGFVYSSPAVADIDGVTGMEVVIGSNDHKVYCLNGVTGVMKWSYKTGGDVYSPAIADIDGDGNIEVIIGSCDKKVYSLNGTTGLVEWSYITGDWIYSSPAIADVDGDGAMEVVIGSMDDRVYCLNGVTGGVEWSYKTGDAIKSSPAIADVDGDGTMEVMIGSNDNKVYCLNGVTGGVEWSYNVGSDVHRGISIADLDGDVLGECKLEILVPSNANDWFACLNGEDGSVLWTKQLAKDVHDITIADIDNDGCIELIVGTMDNNKIWALDDVGNQSDCFCDSSNSIEENNKRASQIGIEFSLMGKGVYLFTPNAVQVNINVYDVSGSLEQTIYKGVLNKGGHTFMPNIKNSGVYFITLQSRNFKQSLKMIRF